ncbi:MAG: hypothetical protein ACOWWH_05905 [Eubacteriaceae bacterium]
MIKKCLLNENKICNDCGQCLLCDLDKNKVCNNCGACLENNNEYSVIRIDNVEDGIDNVYSREDENIYMDWLQKS